MDKKLTEFLTLLVKLDIIEIVAIAKILGITLITGEEKSVKEFNQVYNEIQNAFAALSSKKKQNLLKIVKNAVREKEHEAAKERETEREKKKVKFAANANLEKPNVNLEKPNVDLEKPNVDLEKPNVNLEKPNVDLEKTEAKT